MQKRELCVLVVEDEEAVRKMHARKLHSFGIITVEAVNGRDALNLIESGHVYDAILTDNRMPLMTGRELITKLRDEVKGHYEEVPIVMVSSDDLAEFCKENGVRFVLKPCGSEDVGAAMLGAVAHLT
jgi:CheY-like chemotaxis protein